MSAIEAAKKVGVFSISQLFVACVSGRKREVGHALALLSIVTTVLVILATAAPASAAENYAWVSKGPVGTQARNLVCSSNNAGTVYVGTDGGVFKTTDYGDSWFYSGLRFQPIDALRGTGGCNQGLLAGASRKVYQSINGGSTWNDLGPVNSGINALLMTNPTAPFSCQGYIGTSNGVLTPNGPRLPGQEITALAADSSNNVYAGTGDGGIYKTTDNGVSWLLKNNGLPDPAPRVFSLKIDGNDRIFAGTGGGGVFRSTDGGDNWTPKNTNLPNFDGNLGFYIAYSLAKDPAGNLYAGMITDNPISGSVYKSTNNGDSWSHTDSAIDGFFPESMCATPDNKLFVGTNLGTFRTDDAGSTWVNQTNKISAIPFTNTFAAVGATIFVGSEAEGVYESADGGETWTPTGTGGPQCIGALLADGSGNLYASTCDIPGVYRSTNGGADWILSSNNLPSDDSGFLIQGDSLALDGSGSIYVGLDNGEVWKTTDQADSWSATGPLPSNTEYVSALAGIGTATVLAGTDGNGIYKTVNGGTTWQQKNTGLPANASIVDNSFFVDKANPGYIFVALSGGGLYRSTDNGENWGQVSPLNSSCDDARSVTRGTVNTGILYAVICDGIVQSSDNGASWTPFVNSGLNPGDNVQDRVSLQGVFAYNSAFVAATESSGMYKFSKDLAIIEGAPGVYYASLQDAYNAAQSGDSILALAVNFYSEDLFFNTPGKSVILIGGYEADFTVDSGKTSVTRALTVSQGTVVLQNMIIRALTISGNGTVYAENVIVR